MVVTLLIFFPYESHDNFQITVFVQEERENRRFSKVECVQGHTVRTQGQSLHWYPDRGLDFRLLSPQRANISIPPAVSTYTPRFMILKIVF